MNRFRSLLARYPWTLRGLGASLALWIAALILDLDLFEQLMRVQAALERFELDELLLFGGIALCGLVADVRAHKRQREQAAEIQAHRLKIMKATIRTVQDVSGNFLNNLNFFLLEAEEDGGVCPTAIREMRALVHETSHRLSELADLEGTPVKDLAAGITVLDLDAARGCSRGNGNASPGS